MLGISVAEIPVRIHPLFLLILAVAGAAGHLRAIGAVLVALALHELAHLVAAKAYDIPVQAIEIWPFGAAIRAEGLALAGRSAEAVIAVAGPLQSLFLFTATAVARSWLGDPFGLVDLFLEFNAGLALFNLLPVPPLDGGRLARALLVGPAGERRVSSLLDAMGLGMSAALVAAGGVSWAAGSFVPNLPVLGLFLGLAVHRERRARRLEVARRTAFPRERTRPVTPARVVTARGGTSLGSLLGYLGDERYLVVLVTDGKGKIRGVLDEGRLLEALRRGGAAASLDSLLHGP